MSHYIYLKVKEVRKETDDAVSIIFYKPTTYSTYKSGQFLTLIVEIGAEKLRRSYSLCSSPFVDEDWAISVKKVEGGKVSNYLVEQVKPGDIIETMVPAGIFTYEPSSSNTNDLLIIAAGSGITPLMSIIKSILTVEDKTKVYLLYQNRDEQSVILYKELQKYEQLYPTRLYVNYLYSRSSTAPSLRLERNSIITYLKAFVDFKPSATYAYTCGPQGLMDEAFVAFGMLGIAQENCRKESFYTVHTPIESATNNSSAISVKIKYGKQHHTIQVGGGQTILEAALDQDIDLPYSCQSGMCTACMGKCIKGKVEMDNPDGLSQNEIKQGFVLTCVGKPLTEDVEIEIE